MSGTFDPLAARAAQASAPTTAYDPLALVAAGRALPAANESSVSAPGAGAPTWEQTWLTHGNPVNQFTQGAFDRTIASAGGAIAGGLKGLWDLARGQDAQTAASDVGKTEQNAAYQPQTGAEQAGAEFGSGTLPGGSKLPLGNPLNWPADLVGLPGNLVNAAGKGLGSLSERLGAPPIVSTALRVAPAVAASVLGLKGMGIEGGEAVTPEVEAIAGPNGRVARVTPGVPVPKAAPIETPWSATSAPRAPYAEVSSGGQDASHPEAPPDGPPVDGGLPKDAQDQRRAILDRVGILEKRKSAVQGDAQSAATDYQATKFDEPAGRAMSSQFENERNALAGFTHRLITTVGGSVGLDEDALINRGIAIDKPFDSLRAWFGQQQKDLYAQAQQRSDELSANGNPSAYTQLQGVDSLLKSPDFRNTLMARDQGNLLTAIQAQLGRFRETNPTGFTPAAAEQVRQWLNQVWSPDNRWAIGRVKDALDSDVAQQAGEDIFGRARAIRALKAQTLENPKGISSLFDADPQTPINRVTPFERIPDKIMALPAEQFQNLVDTLRQMPPELQSDAQLALGEIKGQLVNRLLKAGTETRSGRGAQVWKGEDVSQTLARHAAKFRIAFDGDPETQAAIKDLNSAGQILRVNEGYPGAYAQAANMAKRGVGSAVVRQLARVGGAAVGGVAGPLGAAAGELGGGAAGEAAASALAERAALKAMRKRIETPVDQ